MGKCLNCGKEVKNKFCSTSCQNQYRAKLIREEYEKNPKTCQCCGKTLDWEHRRNKYCSNSCAAKINNIGKNRHDLGKSRDFTKVYQCSDEDFIEIINNFTSWTNLYKDLGYTQGRSERKQYIIQRCEELGINCPADDLDLSNRTKGDLFKCYKNWQSARSTIRRHAQNTFVNSGAKQECLLCNYNKHVEIAHVKAVSDFDDNALISDINNIHNLIALCPNHHWEFDNNCLSKENLDKIKNYYDK